ncbi:hypothetical protein LCGC14_0930840 [marine sediment metagenome]|uniref:Uncharacterized protein n=1 Tax=marine sediment metagenome TaxID=412755 RepID=A0A0F9NN31_9ZZZZ|nr:hypothetical protein [archaeon]
MARKIDKKRDLDILEYLKSHTYVETAEQFKISEMTISRIKKRNNNVSVSDDVSVGNNVSVNDNENLSVSNAKTTNLNEDQKVSVSDEVSVGNNVSVSDEENPSVSNAKTTNLIYKFH